MLTSLALLVGLWTGNCTQTQISRQSGYVLESFEIKSNGDFLFGRQWFSTTDMSCQGPVVFSEGHTGSIKLGNQVSDWFNNQTQNFQADFTTQNGTDLGMVAVGPNYLRFARGVTGSPIRNTMIGFFQYFKK